MPKYAIHHIVLKEAISRLYEMGNGSASNSADMMEAEMPSAVIGSIGPDLFFWGTDYEVMNKLLRLHNNIVEIVSIYNKILQPIRKVRDAVVEPVEDLVETLAPTTVGLIRRCLGEIQEASSIYKSMVATGLLTGVLEGANLVTDAAGIGSLAEGFFDLFTPHLQKNRDEKEWYWFDILHYRKTGQFARNLVNGSNSSRTKAFALGYLSHIATDVVGHAYVNQIVGNPYRRFVQRHVVVENYQDTWKFAQYYNGASINHSLLTHLGLPVSLPSDIGDLLFNAFKETYGKVNHPKFYTRAEIDITYENFYKVLELMKMCAVERPEEPFSGAAKILSDVLENFGSPPQHDSPVSTCNWKDFLPWNHKSRKCYETFFEQMDNWLNYLGELVKWSLKTLGNLIDLLHSLLLSLPISVLLAILYGIQLMCYQIYRSARKVLSINGFTFPEPDELNNSIGSGLISLCDACTDNFNNFPCHRKVRKSHLVCWDSGLDKAFVEKYVEKPTTAAGFCHENSTFMPDSFITEDPFNENVLREYALSEKPEITRQLQKNLLNIGNARDFTAWLIRNASLSNLPAEMERILYTDWNLDADRGYGYHAWSGIFNSYPHEGYVVDNEEYI